MTLIIAISGWKGSGKDTAADYLVREHGYRKLSFAAALKDLVAEQYNIDRESLDDQVRKEVALPQYPVVTSDGFSEMIHKFMDREFARDAEGNKFWTPRALAILEGSAKRSVNSGIWVQRVIDSIHNEDGMYLQEPMQDYPRVYVISDLRYRSEVDKLRKAFGKNLITVRINRHDSSPSTDPSEHDLDDAKFDVVLNNKDLQLEKYYGLLNMTLGFRK